jgi:hypothetical protein
MNDQGIEPRESTFSTPGVEGFHEATYRRAVTPQVKILRGRKPRGLEYSGIGHRLASILSRLDNEVNGGVYLIGCEGLQRAYPLRYSV